MGHFFSKVSLFIDKKEAAAHLILDQDFATAPFMIYVNLLFVEIPISQRSAFAIFERTTSNHNNIDDSSYSKDTTGQKPQYTCSNLSNIESMNSRDYETA